MRCSRTAPCAGLDHGHGLLPDAGLEPLHQKLVERQIASAASAWKVALGKHREEPAGIAQGDDLVAARLLLEHRAFTKPLSGR